MVKQCLGCVQGETCDGTCATCEGKGCVEVQTPTDTMRLEWLIKYEGEFHLMGKPERGYKVCDLRDGMTFLTPLFPTYREAIDYGMGICP